MVEQLSLLDGEGPVLVAGPIFVCFELQGNPRGKGRPRGTIIRPKFKAPFISFYTPEDTRDYEVQLAKAGRDAMAQQPMSNEPIALIVHAFMPIPVSWPDRDFNSAMRGSIVPTGKPDGDNILKIVGDALNMICYRDDAQIVDARVIKRYSDIPGLRVELRELIPRTGP